MIALDERDVDRDPIRQFARWYEEAWAQKIFQADAMALATATLDGAPSVRMVLLKGFDGSGFRFYTNYESQKAIELRENSRAALLFHWRELGRQVRIIGEVARLSAEESGHYFATRPLESQLAAWASHQSEPVASRAVLEQRVEELTVQYAGREVPLPPFWGGYCLAPHSLEFWQHRDSRLHDRLRYRLEASGSWVIERLAP